MALTLAGLAASLPGSGQPPIHLHPENPHYFRYEGKPTVLITSGEHYGGVLNASFDFEPYFRELASHDLNQTRTFAGTYREVPGSFGIKDNTLAPTPGNYMAPWPRTDRGTAQDGLGTFDLSRWNSDYFERLKRFVQTAGKHGVIVELVLFCTFYEDILWEVNPMNPANNVNELGLVHRDSVYTLGNDQLVTYQEQFVEKVVTELNAFDNLYFEIANEPYFGSFTDAWTDRMVRTIVETEENLPQQHLIAQNIANNSAEIDAPHPQTSIFNFHYAEPAAVSQNYHLNKANEPYRMEAWQFMLAGGAVFSNLDYSFTPTHPDGTADPSPSPGGGGEQLREELSFLKSFLEEMDFVRMQPDSTVVRGGLPDTVAVQTLAEAGQTYAMHFTGGGRISPRIALPRGDYRATWYDPTSGSSLQQTEFTHEEALTTLSSPSYRSDIALRIVRQ